MYKLIKNIDIRKPESWKDKIFITSDIDWACDEVMNYTINIFEKHNARVTFFATHKTKIFEDFNSHYEIGIHPNFNFLLNGDFRYGKNYSEVIKYYKEMFPDAVSVRSHSMTQSTLILDEFCNQKLKYDVNHFIPFDQSDIDIFPWKYWKNELIKIPYFWEDDLHISYNKEWDIDRLLNSKGIKVFDFHPVHIFLNTDKMERYEAAKPFLRDYKKLKEFVNRTKYGTRDYLIELLNITKN